MKVIKNTCILVGELDNSCIEKMVEFLKTNENPDIFISIDFCRNKKIIKKIHSLIKKHGNVSVIAPFYCTPVNLYILIGAKNRLCPTSSQFFFDVQTYSDKTYFKHLKWEKITKFNIKPLSDGSIILNANEAKKIGLITKIISYERQLLRC